MKKIRLARLYEWHPGARDIDESIFYFINRAKELGIDSEDLMRAIELLINYRETGESVEVNKETFIAITHMENAIDTMIDDGWPEDWIYAELNKLIRATD